jgi:hypothetical protein
MNSPSIVRKSGSERGDYGFARARDIAFDAVLALWRKRQAEGMKQSDIASILNHDPAWVSRQLKGPGNWTLRTIGELVEAMDGELDIAALGFDEPIYPTPNYDAYSDYGVPTPLLAVVLGSTAPVSITSIERLPITPQTTGNLAVTVAELQATTLVRWSTLPIAEQRK